MKLCHKETDEDLATVVTKEIKTKLYIIKQRIRRNVKKKGQQDNSASHGGALHHGKIENRKIEKAEHKAPYGRENRRKERNGMQGRDV